VKRYLFDFLEEIINRIKAFSRVLLFLDYDGTLVPICKEPSLAKLSLEEKRVLRTLSRMPWLSVGIISGRSLKEVRKLVGINGLFYAGNHGFEILFSEGIWVHPEIKNFGFKLKRVTSELKRSIKGINGILVEDKRITVSVHYRNLIGKSPGSILKIVSKVLEPYPEIFTITRGKKVYEVRPHINWDKGKAVVKISQLLDFKNRPLKIYVGDDQTDEDAFRVLENGDISIRVGYKKGSKARYFCRGSGEISRFLEEIALLRNSKK
jgi:trehalose 6-phosphate phosphatase